MHCIGGGQTGGGWGVVGVGGKTEGGLYHPKRQIAALCLQQSTEPANIGMVGTDGRWQPFDTLCSLNSAPKWTHAQALYVVNCRRLTGLAKDCL